MRVEITEMKNDVSFIGKVIKSLVKHHLITLPIEAKNCIYGNSKPECLSKTKIMHQVQAQASQQPTQLHSKTALTVARRQLLLMGRR